MKNNNFFYRKRFNKNGILMRFCFGCKKTKEETNFTKFETTKSNYCKDCRSFVEHKIAGAK